MSKKGIDLVAKLFSEMQSVRMELFRMGAEKAKTPDGKADILLAHMLSDGNDAMKDAFMQITSGRYPREDKPIKPKKKTLGRKIA